MNRPTAPGRASSKPLYQVVEDHIRGLIDSGELVPGDLIPSEPQLARQLNVSPGTAKKAIDNLVWEQRLYRHQGKGTYVSKIDFNNSLFRFTTYGDAAGQPTRLHKETTARRIEPGTPALCSKLGTAADAALLYVERVGYVDEQAVMVEYSHWRADVVPGLEREDVHIPDLFYALIVDKYGIPVVRAEETLTAGGADPQTAAILGIRPGEPVLVLNRETYTSNNRIIEIRVSKGRADRFSYKTEIR
ncbi:MAG: GntR family transcriptional regulator [Gammaproteobacteria bacterium]|nr:GntR family transcriptional regulator [Gammaproteobacteria bacterium]